MASKTRRGRPNEAGPKLLEAAVAEFAAKGFDGASTAAIARRAGVTQPLVHHHFGTKQGLFDAVLASLFAELAAELLDPQDRQLAPGEMVERLIRFTARRPELTRIWVIESGQRTERAQHIAERFVRPMNDMMLARAEEVAAAGLLPRVDPQLLFLAVQGMAAHPFLVAGERGQDPAFVDAYVDAVLTLLFRQG